MKSRLKGKRIILGVTGGIAAYKSAYLVRLLRGEGADVKVVMTRAACEFVTPLTFETLSENKVHIHMFGSEASAEGSAEGTMAGGEPAGAAPGDGTRARGMPGGDVSAVEHIDLAKWAELVVVAPVTANTIAKLARGGADDLLSTVVTAYDGPVVLAPAMNDVMWRNAATQANLRDLSGRGYRVIPPGTGDLACGYEAEGRMAEPEAVVEFVETVCNSDFAGLRVLISVGGTEEDLDPVRVITNRSSGRMGFALAEAARNKGAVVTVVMGRVAVPPPVGVRVCCRLGFRPGFGSRAETKGQGVEDRAHPNAGYPGIAGQNQRQTVHHRVRPRDGKPRSQFGGEARQEKV
jgi:phosphopantothenoylcysteine decarboxylase/phosphopantothenate--cysteine ligase